jgi:hypothetical protein
VLFEIILERAGDGPLEISLSELCRLSGFTKLTVRRALRRLEAVRLIRREGGGGRGRKTRIFLLWKRFPQGKGLPVRSNVSLGTQRMRETLRVEDLSLPRTCGRPKNL